MKRVLIFLSGFLCCLIFIQLFGEGSNSITNAKNKTYEFVKAEYPIYVNGVLKNVEAYNYKGYTYLKMNDLKSTLNNLNLEWDNSSCSVYIGEKTGLGFLAYNGKTYVDLARIAFRYQNGRLPYCYDTKLDCIYKSEGETIEEEVWIELLSKKADVSSHYPNSGYFEYELIKENLIQLLKMTYENESYINENPHVID